MEKKNEIIIQKLSNILEELEFLNNGKSGKEMTRSDILTEDYKILECRIKILEEENTTLSNCNAALQDEVENLKYKIDDLEEKILELGTVL